MQLSISQINQIKSHCLHLAQQHVEVMLFDNHFSANTFELHQVEFMAAFGMEASLVTDVDAFSELDLFLKKHHNKYVFCALSYDLKNELEALTSTHENPIQFPKLIAFVPKQLIVIDAKGNCTQGLDLVLQCLDQPQKFQPQILPAVVPQPKVSKYNYLKNVEAIRQHILEGDVYELNYCTEFFANSISIHPYTLYQKLMEVSPVPFGAFFKWGDKYLICASPERFLCGMNGKIYSQPIKGTTPRKANVADDELQKLHLLNSEKEKAENLMIVDLVRNDLARTALTGTVKVEELFGIYSFKQVHQMISTVSSNPKKDVPITEVIKCAFPMGSMTGAPKIMAMELIEQYEETCRGLYSGSVGYFAPDGTFDLNVVIRSIQYNATNQYLNFEVGGAITFDSVPEEEYNECLLKAKAMMQVLGNKP
ncbi:MAG: anthranilate synthase component I family protein [Bacteroidota bacterium]